MLTDSPNLLILELAGFSFLFKTNLILALEQTLNFA